LGDEQHDEADEPTLAECGLGRLTQTSFEKHHEHEFHDHDPVSRTNADTHLLALTPTCSR